MRFFVVLAILLLGFGGSVSAAEWQLNPEKSTITFTYYENETPKEGAFPTFEGEAFYDPAWQKDAIVQVRVSNADVQMEDFVRTAYAKTPGWFDTLNHPQAVLNITALEPFEDGRIRAIGELTLKGETFAMTPIFQLDQVGACLRAHGSFPMQLSDYGIGAGAVSRLINVQDEVILNFDLTGHLAFAGAEC
jgi:polyisoprenoid-binding protein YceI